MSQVEFDVQEEVKEVVADNTPVWRIVSGLIRFRWQLWLANMAAMTVMTLSMVIPGLAIKWFFDLLSGEEAAMYSLWTLVAFLVVAEIIRSLGSYGLIRTNVPFFVHTLTLMRKNMLKYILKKPGARALPDSPGEAMSRFSGDAFELSLFALWLNDFIGLLALSTVSVVLMASIDPAITALTLVPFIIVGFAAHLARNRVEHYRRAARRWTGIVVGYIGEVFGAIQAIKISHSEEGALNQFSQLNEQRKRTAVMDKLFTEILQSVFLNSANLGTGVILIFAAASMRDGSFSVGDFALFLFYLEFISELTAFAGMLLARYQQMGVSVARMERLMEGAPKGALVEPGDVYVLNDQPDVTDRVLDPVQKLKSLEVRDLTHVFEGTDKGVHQVSFTLTPGSFTVITGRVGAGKTTLIRTLLGLLPRDAGEILWNDKLIEHPADFFVPPLSAYTSQVPRLFSESLRDNILMGMKRSDDEVEAAIHAAVLNDDLNNFENHLDTLVGPKGVKLSGGQIQRVAAARMYLRSSELLVFDDLSSALDVNTEKVLWDRLAERREVTCLVVSHRRAALERADQILILENGKVAGTGTFEEVRGLLIESELS